MTSPPVPQFHFSGSKAGMQDVDKSRVDRIISENSRGNPYYEKAVKVETKSRERAERMRKSVENLTRKDLSVAKSEVDAKVAKFDVRLDRTFVVIDMDMFFVAVEMRDDPSLKDKPVAVGTTLISTANYAARAFGVRSAMPTFLGRKLCPQLVVVPGRYPAYVDASAKAREVFLEYDTDFVAGSLDEAYLDITDKMQGLTLASEQGRAIAGTLVQELRAKVKASTGGLTCSAGLAPTKMIAKICSEQRKPDGQFILDGHSETVLRFIRGLAVRKIPGIGKSAELQLELAFGVKTAQDLWDKRYEINRVMTPALADFYLRVPLAAAEWGSSFGADGSDDEDSERKSISVERTFQATNDVEALKEIAHRVCEKLAEGVRIKNLWGKTITLKIKTHVFDVRSRAFSRSSNFGGPSVTGAFLYSIVEPLLRQELPVCMRLLGVRLSGLGAPNVNFDSKVWCEPEIKRFLSSGSNGGKRSSPSPTMEVFDIDEDDDDADPTVSVVTAAAAEAMAAQHCPICSRPFTGNVTNDVLNSHIDSCLSLDAVHELSKSSFDKDYHKPNVANSVNPPSPAASSILKYFGKRNEQ